MPGGSGRRVVLGIGNPDRGDDAVGPEVVGRLYGRLASDVALKHEAGEAAKVLAAIETADAAYLVDACAAGQPPGSVLRFDVSVDRLPQQTFAVSTHGIGLAEAIELARALGQLPTRCIVYAIEGACFDAGAGLSPEVADAIPEVVGRLISELQHVDDDSS